MARINLVPLLASCVLLAAVFCVVQADCEVKSYKFTVFEQMDDAAESQVFKDGKVYENIATKSADSNSEVYATVPGFYYKIHHSRTSNIYQEISSIQFVDIGEKGGSFADAIINLRMQWYTDRSGEDLDTQYASIVGGTKGLAGAYGTVKFTKTADGVFRTDGQFSICK